MVGTSNEYKDENERQLPRRVVGSTLWHPVSNFLIEL